MATTIAQESKVKVHYKATFDDGTVFDTSEGREPLEFTIGQGQVIKGFEEGLQGMHAGEKKTIKILPKDGYGEKDSKLVQAVPRDKFPADLQLKKGMVLTFKGPNEQKFMVVVDKVSDNEVTLDLNHPLAGKNLNFAVDVVSVE